MNDRPGSRELLDAVEAFLRQDVIPAVDGHVRYQVRVAANVVAIVAREIDLEEGHLQAEWQGLMRLLGRELDAPADRSALNTALQEGNEALVERIRAGEADEGDFRREVMAHLKKTVQAKLQVALGDSESS